MGNVSKCKNKNSYRCLQCGIAKDGNMEFFEQKLKTHYDEIRAMSIEEIENWFWWMHKEMMNYTDSRVFLHDWLKQEVNDG